MRILIASEDIPYPNMGGLAKHALNLARALARAGHKVDLLGNDEHPIAVCGEEGSFGGHFIGELNGFHAGWKEVSLGTYMPLKRTVLAKRFASIILRHAPNYDVVHYHGHVPNVALFIPESINFVQTRHDQGSDCFRHTRFRNGEVCRAVAPGECAGCLRENPNALQRTVSAIAVSRYRDEVARSFRKHKTVFVSNLLQDNLVRTLGPGPWGATIHNFVDRPMLEELRDAASRLPPPAGVHVFIASKLYPAKGIEKFLQTIAPRLPAQMRLTIVGDGGDEARLRKTFESNQVQFLGWCSPDKTLKLAAASSAVVVPSVCEESCATTVLEGLFLGKPTFALQRGGTPELAAYQAVPGQLRLHPDMPSLVDDLIGFDLETRFGFAPEGVGSADLAAQKLLHIYRLPPGHFIR